MERIHPSETAVRFGVFEVDLRARELRKQGVRLKLQDQPLEVLLALLERPSEVVTRDELQQKIWPSDTFVDFDHGLYNAIKRLREALGENAEKPQYIETAPRRGYRFIGKIEARHAGAAEVGARPVVARADIGVVGEAYSILGCSAFRESLA